MKSPSSTHSFRMCVAGLILIYGVGLTRDLTEPWIGLHDWNGAFYSQLARNFLRYPVEVHHGMGVVAMGEAIPPVGERSIYATHPPGVVWLVAAAFSIGGQSEAVARMVPIAFSLGSLALFIYIAKRRYGEWMALLIGAIYCCIPMSVYFGRMVNHEPMCLFFMLAAITCWDLMELGGINHRHWAMAGWAFSITSMVWIDWPGVLFAGLFALWIAYQWRMGKTSTKGMAIACLFVLVIIASMLCYLVYAGLDGRWGDLWAIFTSRSGALEGRQQSTLWENTIENLQWPILILSTCGLVIAISKRWLTTSNTESPSINSLDLIFFAGLIWILVFLRQYRIHSYWLFYLGPHAAIFATRGIESIAAKCRSALAARVTIMCGIALIIGFGAFGIANLYQIISCKPELVATFREVNSRTRPSDRVQIAVDPIKEERHGGYVFRNIAPAQLAYYLDRAITVSSRTSK